MARTAIDAPKPTGEEVSTVEPAGGWLCPTEHDRARVLDMSARVRRARVINVAAVGVGLIVIGPWVGWWTLALVAAVAINLAGLDGRLRRSRRPERTAAYAVAFVELMIVVLIVADGHDRLLPWLILPAVMVSVRFRERVALAAAAMAGAIMLAIAFGPHWTETLDDPVPLIVSLVLLVGVSAVTSALADAEHHYRRESVLDPLTGLLNRNNLEPRLAELREQARAIKQPICLLWVDIDDFKAINDRHGHVKGDAVLSEATRAMRDTLRSFELFYRVGGEEFLLILPGVELEGGRTIAERLRAAVERTRPGGIDVTVSIGVSDAAGSGSDVDSLIAADHALYFAKRTGRNRVVVAQEPAQIAAREDGHAARRAQAPATHA